MSDMELAEVEGEKIYKPKDVVWVKLSGMWWPAEVQDQELLDPEVTEGLKKPLLCVVQFLLESSYLHIKSLDQIYHYNCKKKKEFLKLGFKKYSRTKNEKNMAIWPDVIQEAERRTGGDPDIINDPEIVPVAEKPEAASNMFGARASLPGGVRRGQGQRRSLPAGHFSSSSINALRQQLRPGVSGSKGKSTQHISISMEQRNPPMDEEPKPPPIHYSCMWCHFTTHDVEWYMLHLKFNHYFGRSSMMAPPATIRNTSGPSSKPKKEKRRREETATTPVIKKRKKKSVVKTKETTPGPLEKEDPPCALEVSQECEQILKDWDDEDDELREGDRTSAFQEDSVVISDAGNDDTMSRAVEETSDTPVGKNDAPDDTGESGSKNAQAQPPPPKTSSCFDFDDEEPAQPEVQSLKFGQKLPRVISLEKTKSSTVDALADGRELDSFLNEVAVPQLPSIPSNKHAYSPSKEPKGSEKSLSSPTNESVRKSIDKKKVAISASSNRDLDDKKKVGGDEVVTSEEQHFLAGGPLQSKKRKGSGLTEGAEDGSAGKKQKSFGDDEPSMKNDIQSDVGGDEYENVGSQLYKGNPKPDLVILGEVGDKASITTDLSGSQTKDIESPPQSVITEIQAKTNDLISIVASSSKSKGTISELDKQSLIDTLTYSPSSVDIDTSQKRVKTKFEDTSLEDTQLDSEQERSEVVFELDKQSLIDTLTHSPAPVDTGKSDTSLEQDQYKKSSRVSRRESSKTSDSSTLRRGSRVSSSSDSRVSTSRSTSSRNSSHNPSKDKHSEVSPGQNSKSDKKSPKSKKSRRWRHEQDTKGDLETSGNSPKPIGENDNNPKDRPTSFSPKSKKHKIDKSKKSFEINGAKCSPTRANDSKADVPSDKAQETISNESIKSGEVAGTENTTKEKQSDPPSDENAAVICNEKSKLSSSEDRSYKNSPKNSGQNVEEVSSRMCESHRHPNTSCIDTMILNVVDSIQEQTSSKEAKSDVNSENHIKIESPSSPFSCLDSSKGDETLQKELPTLPLNTSTLAEKSKIFLEKNEFLEVSKLMPWKQNEMPKPSVGGESGSVKAVKTPQDEQPHSKDTHVDDMKKNKSPEVSRAEEPVQSQDKSHKSVFKTDLGTPKKDKSKGHEKDTRDSKSSKHKSEYKQSKNSLLSEETGSNEPSDSNFTKYSRSKRTSRFDQIQDKPTESIPSPSKSLPTSPDITKDLLSKPSTPRVDKGHSRSMPSSQSRSSESHVELKAKECSTKAAPSAEGVSEDGGRTISDKRHSRSSRHTSKTRVDLQKSNSTPGKDREQTEGVSGVNGPELVAPKAVDGLRRSNRSSSSHDSPSTERVSEGGGRTNSDKKHSRSSRRPSKTRVDLLKSNSTPSKDREHAEGEPVVHAPELLVPKAVDGLRRSSRSSSSHDSPSAERVSEDGGRKISDKKHSRSSRHTSETQVDLLKSNSSSRKNREHAEGESVVHVPELVVPKAVDGLRRSSRSSSSHDSPSAERVSEDGGRKISDKKHSRSSRHTSKTQVDLLKSNSSTRKNREHAEGESSVHVPELVVPKAVDGLRRSNRPSSSHDSPSAERVSEKKHSRSSRHTSKTQVDLLKSSSTPSKDRVHADGESGVDVPVLVVPIAAKGLRRNDRSSCFDNIVERVPRLAPSADETEDNEGQSEADTPGSHSVKDRTKTKLSSRSKSSHSITQESTPSSNIKAKSKVGVHSETATHTTDDEGLEKQRRSSRSRENLVITQKSPSSHDRSSIQHLVKDESRALTPTASDGDGNGFTVTFPHATDDSGQSKTKRPSRSLDSEEITCSLSNPSNDIGVSSKDVGSRTEQSKCGKADDNLSPNQHELVQTASPKTTCGATPSTNQETSVVVSKPTLFNESKEDQDLTPSKEFLKGLFCDKQSFSVDKISDLCAESCHPPSQEPKPEISHDSRTIVDHHLTPSKEVLKELFCDKQSFSVDNSDDLCVESCHSPSQEPKPEISHDSRSIGDHDAQVAPGGRDETDNQITKTRGASAGFPVDPAQFIKEHKAPNNDSEMIGAELENKSVVTAPVSPVLASSKVDCMDLSMSQGQRSPIASSGIDTKTMQSSNPIDGSTRILPVLQPDEPPFKSTETDQSCVTPHVAVDSTSVHDMSNDSSAVHMKDESASIVRIEEQNEEIASAGISKVESKPEGHSTLIVQTEEQEEGIGFGNTTAKETKSELVSCKTSEADFTSPPMDALLDSQLKNCVLLPSPCSKVIGQHENEFETFSDKAPSLSKDDVTSLFPHLCSGDDSKVEIGTPVREPSALHPRESGSPLKYVESPEGSTEIVKPTPSVPTLNVVLVSEIPEKKADKPDEPIFYDKSSSALSPNKKLLTQTDLVNTSDETKLSTAKDKGQKETLELPQVPVVTARASRWDNPFPTKKMENRPITPIQSFMASPTKVGTGSLSPASKVKVEIKSGLGRNCFKYPPPDVKSANKDAKPTQSESVELENEDHAFAETGRLDTNLPEQTTKASDFDDELSALQAEIASYSESKLQDVPLKPDLIPATEETAPRQEPSRVDSHSKVSKTVGVEDTENQSETTQRPHVSSRGQIMDLGNLLAFDISLDSIPLPECPKSKPSTKETPLQQSKVPGQREAALLASLLKGDEVNVADHELSNAAGVASPPTEIIKTELPATKTGSSSNKAAVVVKEADNSKAFGKTKSNLLSPLVTSLTDLPVVISNIPLPQSDQSISSSDFDSFEASSESHQAPIVIPVEPPKVSLPDKHCPDNTPTSRVEVLEVERSQPQVGMAMGVIDPSKLLDLNDIPFVFEEDLIEEGLMPSETSSMRPPTVNSLSVGATTESALLDDKEIKNTVTSSAMESEERFAIEDLVEEVVEEEPATDSTLSGNVVTENDYIPIQSNEHKVYEARVLRQYIIELTDDSDPNFEYNLSLPEVKFALFGESASPQTSVDQPAVPAKKVVKVAPIQPKRITTEPKYVSVGGTGNLVSGLSTASSSPQIIRVQAVKPGKPTIDTERQKVQIAGSTTDVQRSKEPLKVKMVKDIRTAKFVVNPHMVQHQTRSSSQKLVFSPHLKGVKNPTGIVTSNSPSTTSKSTNPSLIQINKTPKMMLRGAIPSIISRGRTLRSTVPPQRPSSIPIQRPSKSKVATEVLVNSSTVRVPIERPGLILTNNVLPESTSTNQVLLSGSTTKLVLSSPSPRQTVPKFVSFVVNKPAEVKKPGKDLLEQALTGLDVQNDESTNNMMPTATVVYGMLTDPHRQRPIMTTAVQPSQVLLSHDQLIAFQAQPEEPTSNTVSQSETNR